MYHHQQRVLSPQRSAGLGRGHQRGGGEEVSVSRTSGILGTGATPGWDRRKAMTAQTRGPGTAENPTSKLQAPTSNIEHRTSNIQRPTSNEPNKQTRLERLSEPQRSG